MTATTTLAASVFPRLYRDSVALLALASKLQQREHIVRAGVVMATPANLRLLADSGMLPDGVAAGPDDLLISVRGGDRGAVEDALLFASTALSSSDTGSSEVAERRPQTIAEGVAERPGATVVTVSVPGPYAAVVAEQALRRGRHVMCFSDNVPVEDEVRLKTLAAQRRLLMMGPDCGTAVLDGVPLGFANVLRPGPVGIVAASGTGAQEVSCLLDRAGVGNAALIGVGGRDLTAAVGGVMTELALDLVAASRSTEVIVVVSKPPAPAVAERLVSRLEKLAADGTPVVACLLGMDDADGPVAVRGTLEGAAIEAARLVGVTLEPARAEPPGDAGPAGRVLGLYTGGTLAAEAKVLFDRAGRTTEVIDLGDDRYTAGRPHPMIDPAARTARIVQAAADPTVGVVLLDVVLGHGAHADPAGAVATAVREARAAADRPMAFVASVCGTAADPQGFDAQARSLGEAGVLLAGSNAAAARLAIRLAGGTDAEGGHP
jgi:FdrA protein